MAALQSKGYRYQEHCQIIYIKNLPNFLYKTNQSGPVTMSDVLPWDLIKFQSSETGTGSFNYHKVLIFDRCLSSIAAGCLLNFRVTGQF